MSTCKWMLLKVHYIFAIIEVEQLSNTTYVQKIVGWKPASRIVYRNKKVVDESSSLHWLISLSFLYIFIHWRVLQQLELSVSELIKKISMENKSSISFGGTIRKGSLSTWNGGRGVGKRSCLLYIRIQIWTIQLLFFF